MAHLNTRDSLNRLFPLYYSLPYSGPSTASDPSSLYRFLWNLCFAARRAILPQAGAANHSKHFPLPLACFNILLASTPLSSPVLKQPFSDHGHFPFRTKNGAADTLQCLVAASLNTDGSSSPDTTPLELLAPQIYFAAAKLTQAVDAFLAEILAPIGIHPVGVEEIFSVPVTCIPHSGCRIYLGLIDSNGQVSESAMHALNTYIDQVICPNVEVDERAFLVQETTVVAPSPVEENALLNTSLKPQQVAAQQFYATVMRSPLIFQGHSIQTPPHQIKTRTLTLPLGRTTTGTAEFSFASPSRALKLSSGRWNISSSGTRLVSSVANIVEEEKDQQQQLLQEGEDEDLEVGRTERKRRRRRRSGSSTYITTPPAIGTYRPVDALLAAAADAEEELRRSTPSTTSSGGDGERNSD